jgi:hypothetical protein
MVDAVGNLYRSKRYSFISLSGAGRTFGHVRSLILFLSVIFVQIIGSNNKRDFVVSEVGCCVFHQPNVIGVVNPSRH